MPTQPTTPVSAPTISRRTLAAGAAWAVPAAAVVAAAPAFASSDCTSGTGLTVSGVCSTTTANTYRVTYAITETCPGAIALGTVTLKISVGTQTQIRE